MTGYCHKHGSVTLTTDGCPLCKHGTEVIVVPTSPQTIRDPQFDAVRDRLARVEARLARIESAARNARMDDGLWYISQTIVEEYAQQGLRKLLNVIEDRG